MKKLTLLIRSAVLGGLFAIPGQCLGASAVSSTLQGHWTARTSRAEPVALQLRVQGNAITGSATVPMKAFVTATEFTVTGTATDRAAHLNLLDGKTVAYTLDCQDANSTNAWKCALSTRSEPVLAPGGGVMSAARMWNLDLIKE